MWRRVDGIFHKKGTSHAKVSGKDKSHGHRGSEQRPQRLGKEWGKEASGCLGKQGELVGVVLGGCAVSLNFMLRACYGKL